MGRLISWLPRYSTLLYFDVFSRHPERLVSSKLSTALLDSILLALYGLDTAPMYFIYTFNKLINGDNGPLPHELGIGIKVFASSHGTAWHEMTLGTWHLTHIYLNDPNIKKEII